MSRAEALCGAATVSGFKLVTTVSAMGAGYEVDHSTVPDFKHGGAGGCALRKLRMHAVFAAVSSAFGWASMKMWSVCTAAINGVALLARVAAIYDGSVGIGIANPRLSTLNATLVVNRRTLGFSRTMRDMSAS